MKKTKLWDYHEQPEKMSKGEDWTSENEFECVKEIKTNLGKWLKFECGQPYQAGYELENATREQVFDWFGLTYSSGGEFAGLWSNKKIFLKYGKEKLRFLGMGTSFFAYTWNDRKILLPIAIFVGMRGEFFYFHDVTQYQKHEQKRHNAIKYCDIVNKEPQIKKAVLTVLSNYEGKQYGEKTVRKIADEINKKIVIYNVAGCLCGSGWQHFSYHSMSNIYGKEFCFGIKFRTEANTIRLKEFENDKPHADGEQLFERAESIADNLPEKLKEAASLIKEYNSIAEKICGAIKEISPDILRELQSIIDNGVEL